VAIALFGLMLGMRHATDPDHVIAVTSILSRERRISSATRIGLVWGLGHTVTVLAVGAATIVFKLAIPSRLGPAMEFAVAVVLILLGAPAVGGCLGRLAAPIRRGLGSQGVAKGAGRLVAQPASWRGPGAHPETLRLLVHSHTHFHRGLRHRHPHVHTTGAADGAATAPDHQHLLPQSVFVAIGRRQAILKAFTVGLIHGLAGSAAIALLVLATIPQPLWATLYLMVFCAGTVIGMGLITTAIGAPFAFAQARMMRLHCTLVTSSGLLSFGFGLFIAWQVGLAGNWFGASLRGIRQ